MDNFQLLGITPEQINAYSHLTAEQRLASLNKLRHYLASLYHSDRIGGSDDKMAVINQAIDKMAKYDFRVTQNTTPQGDDSIWREQAEYYKKKVISLERGMVKLTLANTSLENDKCVLNAKLAPRVGAKTPEQLAYYTPSDYEVLQEVMMKLVSSIALHRLSLNGTRMPDNAKMLSQLLGKRIEMQGTGDMRINKDYSLSYYPKRGSYEERRGWVIGAIPADPNLPRWTGKTSAVLNILQRVSGWWEPGMLLVVVQFRRNGSANDPKKKLFLNFYSTAEKQPSLTPALVRVKNKLGTYFSRG